MCADHQYSHSQLKELRQHASCLDDVTHQCARADGLARVRTRPRGCRAGKHKQSTANRPHPAVHSTSYDSDAPSSVPPAASSMLSAPEPSDDRPPSNATSTSRFEHHVGLCHSNCQLVRSTSTLSATKSTAFLTLWPTSAWTFCA